MNTTAKEYAIEMGIIESIDRLMEDINSLDKSGDHDIESPPQIL